MELKKYILVDWIMFKLACIIVQVTIILYVICFADDACGLLLEQAHVLYGLDSDAVPITSIFDDAILECLITQEICTYMACSFLFPT